MMGKRIGKPLGMSWRDVYRIVRKCDKEVEVGLKTPAESNRFLRKRGITKIQAEYSRELARQKRKEKARHFEYEEVVERRPGRAVCGQRSESPLPVSVSGKRYTDDAVGRFWSGRDSERSVDKRSLNLCVPDVIELFVVKQGRSFRRRLKFSF